MGRANAQLCAAIPNNDYYEQLVIDTVQIDALRNNGPLSIQGGVLNVSSLPGLGFEPDWAHLEKTAVAKV
jgi:L-alanine-DL-glutamate epimerase-like enolase superfamily enzyme